MNKVISLVFLALAFASCQSSNDSETTTEVVTDTTSLIAAPAVDTPQLITTSPVTVPATTTPPPVTTTATSSGGNAGLNPQHGQPGHRCDIAVGAPLNSPAGASPTPAITTTPAQAPPQPAMAPSPANKNVKLNPAHGEPGHDCSVAVGQPLKS